MEGGSTCGFEVLPLFAHKIYCVVGRLTFNQAKRVYNLFCAVRDEQGCEEDVNCDVNRNEEEVMSLVAKTVDLSSLTDLINACHADQQKQMRDSPHCYRLFNLALVDGDQVAWAAICAEFERVVQQWVYLHPCFAACGEEVELLTNEAFVRLWRFGRTRAEAGEFGALSHYLGYLKRCVHSAVIDQHHKVRHDKLWDGIELSELESIIGRTDEIDRALYMQFIVKMVSEIATSAAEQIIVKEVWMHGVPPREVQARHPDLFDSAAHVSNIKRNLTKRLQRLFKTMAQNGVEHGLA